MIVALSVVLMALGVFINVFDLTVCAVASLLIAFIYIEVGSPYTFAVWLCTSLCMFLFFNGSVIWLEYLVVFGIYPVLKGYIEKLPKYLWLVFKVIYANIVITAMFFLMELIFKVPLFEVGEIGEKINISPVIITALLWLFLNVCFVLYDIFITVLVRFYFQRLRPRFKNLLK